VRREARLHPRVRVGELVEGVQRVGAQRRAARRVEAVDEGQADMGAQPGVGGGAGHRRGLPVHVPEADGAGADHLDAGEPGPPVDVVGVEAGLGGPDVVLAP